MPQNGGPIAIPSGELIPAGAVYVAHGHAGGLVPLEGFGMRLGTGGLPDVMEGGDEFGYALAAGDFDLDGFDDLAVGAPGEDGAGKVLVVYGSPVSLILSDHRYCGSLEAVGIGNTGAVSIVPGQLDASLIRAPRQLLPVGALDVLAFQDPAGLIPDYRGGAPIYGWALAAGDFDGNGLADLAIGAPARDRFDPSHTQDAGAVAVLYGRVFADGFETGAAGAWSSAAP